MNKQSFSSNKKSAVILIFTVVSLGLGYFFLDSQEPIFNFASNSSLEKKQSGYINPFIVAKFDYLSKNGNSSCSQAFRDSILSMSDNDHLQGSCCSPMSLHRYSEQVQGLKKYQNISEIPSDPYDIEAGLAKKLMNYYDMELTEEEQKSYDFAMQHSDEKGPCCCKCWRWNAYGGLGKHLIRNYGFTGQQVTEVWDLSDGCGGDSDHHHS